MTERVQVTIRLPAELTEQLRRAADEMGFTLHDLILIILWEAIQGTAQE